jgi:hypothetical protein
MMTEDMGLIPGSPEFTREVAEHALAVACAPQPTPVTPKVEKLIANYILIRDKIKEIGERHSKELEEYVAVQNSLTGVLQEFMETSGCDSIKTKKGTCYSSTRYTASLADPKAFMDFVIANSNFDMLDRRANTTAVKEYVKEHNQLPPGVNMSAIKTVGVRRPTEKA